MVQVQQETQDVDPITESLIVDRQAFWTRFTSFTSGAAIVIVVLLLGLWLFVA